MLLSLVLKEMTAHVFLVMVLEDTFSNYGGPCDDYYDKINVGRYVDCGLQSWQWNL